MTSDDTEHTCMTAQALLASRRDPDAFARSLAWKLRFWLLGLPAGVGLGTLRAVLKLWLAFPPRKSGVFSAGNGPAMRAAVIGACAGEDDALKALVRASTLLTHTDPRAEEGALAVALAARYGLECGPDRVEPEEFLSLLRRHVKGAEFLRSLALASEHIMRGAAASEYCQSMGLRKGVSGYVNHTVPVALFCWLSSPTSFREAVEQVIVLGGDADTTGAIVGGIAGATVGEAGIPPELVAGLCEWPRSVSWMRRLADRLSCPVAGEGPGKDRAPLGLFWPGIPARNLFFLMLVLLHGFRRLLPPY